MTRPREPIISATDDYCVVFDPEQVVAVELELGDDPIWTVYLASGVDFDVTQQAGALARIRLEERVAKGE